MNDDFNHRDVNKERRLFTPIWIFMIASVAVHCSDSDSDRANVIPGKSLNDSFIYFNTSLITTVMRDDEKRKSTRKKIKKEKIYIYKFERISVRLRSF